MEAVICFESSPFSSLFCVLTYAWKAFLNLVVRICCVHLYDDSGMMRHVLVMCFICSDLVFARW